LNVLVFCPLEWRSLKFGVLTKTAETPRAVYIARCSENVDVAATLFIPYYDSIYGFFVYEEALFSAPIPLYLFSTCSSNIQKIK